MENSVIKFFKICSSKFTYEDYFRIFGELLLLIITVLYLAKFNYIVALSTAIIICIGHLLIDIFVTPKVEKKLTVLIKRLEAKLLFKEKSEGKTPEFDLKEAFNKLVEQNDVLVKQNEELTKHNGGLLNCMRRVIEVNREYFWKLMSTSSQDRESERVRAIQMEAKSDMYMNTIMNRLDIGDEVKNGVSYFENKCKELTIALESERYLYKMWRERENTLRMKLEEDKQELERDLKEEKEVNMRLDYQVEKLEQHNEEHKRNFEILEKKFENYKTASMVKAINDRDRNLDMKQLVGNILSALKLEIANSNKDLTNDLSRLRDLITKANNEAKQKKALEVEERIDILEEEKQYMLGMISNLEDERDKLMKDNRVLCEKASKITDGLQDKVKCAVDLLNEHIVTNELKSDTLLENQDYLFKMLEESIANDTSSDESQDSYEVVEEI